MIYSSYGRRRNRRYVLIILTLNCGSSSVKYQVYDWMEREIIAKGMVERIGLKISHIEHSSTGKKEYDTECSCPSHTEAIKLIIDTLLDKEYGALHSLQEITAVGHRVVHGGEKFTKSVLIDSDVMTEIKRMQELSPLHNPANILGIEAAQRLLPAIPHAAVLDTAWHQTMNSTSYLYALPYSWYTDHHVRRYGFHGTSYLYTAKRAAVLLGKKPMETNLIIAHIGNGASMCAVKNGICFDTSMGLTPLEGLIMGTRSGDLDPAIIPYMMKRLKASADDIDSMLNKKSGVFGITGKYIDRRDIQDAADRGDERCKLAQDMESYRIKKYLGAYSACLGKVDAVVFTAGVGEMNPNIRMKSLDGLANIGIIVDRERNFLSRCRNGETVISADNSPVKIFVIPTDEELVMTEDAYSLVTGTYDIHTNFTYSFQDPAYVNKAREPLLKRQIEENPKLASILVKAP